MRKINSKIVKATLLKDQPVKANGWKISITAKDNVKVTAPDGTAKSASFMKLEGMVDFFCKKAGGIPNTTPKPKSYPKAPKGGDVLGPDSSTKEPFKKPKVNTQPKPEGKKSDPSLGADSSTNEAFPQPQINYRPQPQIGTGGLPDTDLGPDSSTRNPVWAKSAMKQGFDGNSIIEVITDNIYDLDDDLYVAIVHDSSSMTPSGVVAIASDEQTALEDAYDGLRDWAEQSIDWEELEADAEEYGMNPNDLLTEAFDGQVNPITLQELLESIDEIGNEFNKEKFADFLEEVETDEENNLMDEDIDYEREDVDFRNKESAIKDTFAEPKVPQSYLQLKNASPEEALLKDIGDDEKWRANQELADMDKKPGKGPKCDGKGPKKDTAKKPFNSEEAAEREEGMRGKGALSIKENWGETGDYGRNIEAESPEELYHLVRSFDQEDDYDWSKSSPRQPRDVTETELPDEDVRASEDMPQESRIEAVRRRKALKRRKAVDGDAKSYWSDYMNDYGKELTEDSKGVLDRKDPKKDKKEKKAQDAGGLPPQTEMAPSAPAPAGPAEAPATPAEKPKPSAGAGDEGLKTLGWTDEDVKVMTPEQKQQIMQIQLVKPQPGAPAPVAPAAPAKPAKPAKPAPAPQAPAPVAPAPVQARKKREASDKKKIKNAFKRLKSQAVPSQGAPATPTGPAPAPSAPAEAPKPSTAPATESAPATPATPVVDAVADASPEGQVFTIYNEVLNQDVEASSPTEIQAKKVNELMRRSLSEIGVTPEEVKKIFGKENLMQLFPV